MMMKALSQGDICDISQKIMAKHTGYGINRYNRALNELRAGGHIKTESENGYYTRVCFTSDFSTPAFIYKPYSTIAKELLARLYVAGRAFNTSREITDTALTKACGVAKTSAYRFRSILVGNGVEGSMEEFKLLTHQLDPNYLDNTRIASNGLRKYVLLRTPSIEKQCRICGSTTNEKGKASGPDCKDCYNKKRRDQRIDNLEKMFTDRLQTSRRNILRKGKEFSIDARYCMQLYIEQQGKCYYSGEPFNPHNKFESVSIDRIDSNTGYVPGNVVLCFYIYNIMKNELTTQQFDYYTSKLCAYRTK